MATVPWYSEIARRVAADTRRRLSATKKWVQLETFLTLATRYHAAPGTVHKAVHLLIARGVVSQTGPRTFLFHRRGETVSEETGTFTRSRDVFEKELRQKILGGTYESGAQIPKVSYFVEAHEVSTQTVCAALRALGRDGLIHKRGRRWIVGKPAGVAPLPEKQYMVSYLSRRKEVLIVARNLAQFYSWCGQHLYRFFYERFTFEVAREGVKVQITFIEPHHDHVTRIFGVDQICSRATHLGERFLGFVVLGSEHEYTPAFFTHLLACGRPLIWFDNNRHCAAPAYAEVSEQPSFFICRQHENEAARHALAHLYAHGHRRIGVPLLSSSVYNQPYYKRWTDNRLAALRRYAQGLTPACSLFVRPTGHPLTQLPLYAGKTAFPKVPGGHETKRFDRPTRDECRAAAPEIRDLLHTERVTALIALNDFFGRELYYWCYWAGVDIPRRVSLVSFDNHLVADGLGMTSVDFGLNYAGFQAAHLLLDPGGSLHRTKKIIHGDPWLISRQTVGRPPKTDL